ncbi:aminotransferase [Aurantimonas sp. Leaf443]|uniref:aminotransferase n=1 Tax=Aurantimonas sp. Leaf443 TaxID=1736378 RepID=UPI0006F4FE50|nr:aminotransferase [Aurantimonas sp. Leaf443]KQT88178.1 aspartate/tyrosine/aromatic aminotransferase [Aurantimonas sp. Leaf443]
MTPAASRLARISAPPIARAARWVASYDGRHGPLVDCSQAVPSDPPPPAFAERLALAAAEPAAARYGPVLGDPVLRATYAGHVSARYGARVPAAHVAITAGCNQAFFAAILALAGPSEAVVLPTPWYFNHLMSLEMLGVEARALPTRAEDGFLPTREGLAGVLDERVRALVLVTPNNPTGAVYPPALIEDLFELCVARGIVLVLDETYRDFLEGEAAPHRLFAHPAAETHLVSLYSFSKAYAIPGHRVGALIGGPAFVAQAEKAIDCVQICAPRPPQVALPWAIEHLADHRREAAGRIRRRAELFVRTLAAVPGWRLEQIGAYFAYVAHPCRGVASETVAETLARELGLLVLPGSFFGPGQEGHLRIAFANVADAAIVELGRRLSLGFSLSPVSREGEAA